LAKDNWLCNILQPMIFLWVSFVKAKGCERILIPDIVSIHEPEKLKVPTTTIGAGSGQILTAKFRTKRLYTDGHFEPKKALRTFMTGQRVLSPGRYLFENALYISCTL